jgi:hypothetical protein
MHCAIKNCDFINESALPRTYHRFPKIDIIKQQWINILGFSNENSNTRICSNHFTSGDYSLCKLKRGAVPSQNLVINFSKHDIIETVKFDSYEFNEDNYGKYTYFSNK